MSRPGFSPGTFALMASPFRKKINPSVDQGRSTRARNMLRGREATVVPALSRREEKMAGRWDAGLYDEKHSFVWEHGAALLELLAAQPGERVLDLGRGTGHLTTQLAATGAEVVGLDSSATMIEQARRSYPQLRFEVADARDFSFAEPFDAVFSNAVLHWITEPERVIACVGRALRPGGRFVAE